MSKWNGHGNLFRKLTELFVCFEEIIPKYIKFTFLECHTSKGFHIELSAKFPTTNK